MPKKGERKPESELSQTYASIRMRKLREKRRLENEQKYQQENRVNSKHYNHKWKDIQEAKPDYSNDPTYEELQKRKQEEQEQPEGETPTDDNNSNNDDDKSIDVSVKLPDVDDDMIDEALDEVEKELTKQQRKNKKRREKLKQLKKGNKITAEDNTPLHEDVD